MAAARSFGIVMACYNRREKTLRCLEALAAQKLPEGWSTRTYLLDDGSSDGTGDAVRSAYPDSVVIRGDGTLHWNGGMRAAFGAAIEAGHDFYVWMNDDTYLYDNAFVSLVETYDRLAADRGPKLIVVGSTHEPGSDKLSYGGFARTTPWHPLRLRRVQPGTEPVRCDTINGNCVLIPQAVVDVVGNIDEVWSHAGFIGDNDYGFRAQAAGCENWVAPGYIGVCESNAPVGNSADRSLPPLTRWRLLTGPREGHSPARVARFQRRHGGWMWPLLWTMMYTRLIGGFLIDGVRRRTLLG